MDIARTDFKRKKQQRRLMIGGVAAIALVAITVGLARLKPAAPSVERGSVWIDTVKRGEMLREVRGPGTLVPKEIRWISASSAGRVERVVVKPGAAVEPDTLLVEMTNPELVQQQQEAQSNLNAEQARYASLKIQLEGQFLDEKAQLAQAKADYQSAQLQAEAEEPLMADHIISEIAHKRSVILANQLKEALEIQQQRVDQFADSRDAQLRAAQAQIQQLKNALALRNKQVADLKVRAGIKGVLQALPVQEGQQVTQGTNIARVAQPDELIAELRIAETQAKDIQLGQPVKVDTRNGIVDGKVQRIDPAVQNGTVQVDVELTGELPPGARPDLSVDGTIEIERLPDVLYVGRPAYGQPESTVSLFKLAPDGQEADRVQVQLGKSSVNVVEVRGGLQEGDRVILSDTSAWDKYDRIELD